MRLSDSITLGSTVVKARPSVLYNDSGFGCAIGMAAVAAGARFGIATFEQLAEDSRTPGVENMWPWLAYSMKYPCQCFSHRSSGSDRAKTVIAHIFDHHVFGMQDWSMDKLIMFVRENEPLDFSDAEVWEEALDKSS